MKKVLFFLMFLIMLTGDNYAQDKAADSRLITEQKVPEAPLLDWPLDKPRGFRNYAQELIFNKKMPYEFLHIAWAYYMSGYNGIRTYMGDERFDSFRQIIGIKRYEVKQDEYDKYLRDAYKTEIFTITGGSVVHDFVQAEWYFTKSLQILRDKVKWDPQITNKEIYKDLVKNIYRSMVYCALYIGNYKKSLKYLIEYKKYGTDTLFIMEWEARIFGVLVDIAEKYDWVFVGKMSFDYMKKEHRKLLLKAIDMHYPGESVLKQELRKRIYPDLVIESVNLTNEMFFAPDEVK